MLLLSQSPVEIVDNILKWLHPHRAKSLKRVLNRNVDPINMVFARRNLTIFGHKTVDLSRLDWIFLGPEYVAALLTSVSVCSGLLHIICPEMLKVPLRVSQWWMMTAKHSPPCTIHLKLIQDAIELIVPSRRIKDADITWETCRHPYALMFLARVGAKEALKWAFSQMVPDHPAFVLVVMEMYGLAGVTRQACVLEALEEHPLVSRILEAVPSRNQDLILAYALCGELDKVKDIAKSLDPTEISACLTLFTEQVTLLWRKDCVPNLAKTAKCYQYLLAHTGPKRDQMLEWKYLVISEELADVALTYSHIDNFDSLIEFATPFVIKRIDQLATLSQQLQKYLKIPGNVKQMKNLLHRHAILGNVDVLVAWFTEKILKSQTWFSTTMKTCFDLACHHGHVDLVNLLIDEFGYVPDEKTILYVFGSKKNDIKESFHDFKSTLFNNPEMVYDHVIPEPLCGPIPAPSKIVAVFKIILEKGKEDLNISIKENVALHTSSSWCQPEITKLLLKDPRLKLNSYGNERNLYLDDAEVVKLCHADGRFNFNKLWPFEPFKPIVISALRCESRDPINIIMTNPSMTASEKKVLEFQLACRHGDLKEAQRLVKSGVDPSSLENMAIMHAVAYEKLDIVRFLLSEKRVLEKGDLEIVSQKLSYVRIHGEDVDEFGKPNKRPGKTLPIEPTAKMLKVMKDQAAILLLFLECKAYKHNMYFEAKSAAKLFAAVGDSYGMLVLLNRIGDRGLIRFFTMEIIERGGRHLNCLWELLAKLPSSSRATEIAFHEILAQASPEALEGIRRLPSYKPAEYYPGRGEPFSEMIFAFEMKEDFDEEEDRTGYSDHLSKRKPTRDDVGRMTKLLLEDPHFDPLRFKDQIGVIVLASHLGMADAIEALLRHKPARAKAHDLRLYVECGVSPASVSFQHEALKVIFQDPHCYPVMPRDMASIPFMYSHVMDVNNIGSVESPDSHGWEDDGVNDDDDDGGDDDDDDDDDDEIVLDFNADLGIPPWLQWQGFVGMPFSGDVQQVPSAPHASQAQQGSQEEQKEDDLDDENKMPKLVGPQKNARRWVF
ncbi:hypothetical protein HDU97_001992 [Phlyctochytrium planicorne]|nr:hypothetical protein HDU97_001992 [Phlyctochytrium planicorne]